MNITVCNKKDTHSWPLAIFMLGSLLLVLLEYTFEMFSKDKDLTSLYLFELFFVFTISFGFSVKKLGSLHIFSLVHITLFVFSFGGIVVSFFTDLYNFRDYSSPWASITFTEITIQKVLLLYTAYISSLSLFFWLFQSIRKNKGSTFKYNKNGEKYLILGKKSMLLLFPLSLIYFFLLFKLTFQNRTLLYQAGSMSAIGIPFLIRLGNKFFQVAYYIFLASLPTYKSFRNYSLLYSISLIPLLLSGERGDIAAFVLFFLWYRFRVYGLKTNMKKLGILAVLLVVGFQIIAYTREGDDVESFSFMFLAATFLFSQSQSFNILALFITFNGSQIPHNYPYFLDSLISGFLGETGQSLETLDIRSNIGHQLVYSLNPDYYLSGASLGTSSITEMYEFGIAGVIIGGLMLALFIYYVENTMFKTFNRRLFVFYFFSLVTLSPRGSLLPSLYTMIVITIAFIFLSSIYKAFQKSNRKIA